MPDRRSRTEEWAQGARWRDARADRKVGSSADGPEDQGRSRASSIRASTAGDRRRLGVPLHADAETVALKLDGLDDLVVRPGHVAGLSQPLDGLVVGAITSAWSPRALPSWLVTLIWMTSERPAAAGGRGRPLGTGDQGRPGRRSACACPGRWRATADRPGRPRGSANSKRSRWGWGARPDLRRPRRTGGLDVAATGDDHPGEVARIVVDPTQVQRRQQHRETTRLLHRSRVGGRRQDGLSDPLAPAGGLEVGSDTDQGSGHTFSRGPCARWYHLFG